MACEQMKPALLLLFLSLLVRNVSCAQQIPPPSNASDSARFLIRMKEYHKRDSIQRIGLQKRDSVFMDHATTYINKTLGADFVRENLKLVRLYHTGLSTVLYETTSTKNPEGRNTIILYFTYGTSEVDTIRSKWSKEEIMKSIRGDKDCSLFIGIERAREIADACGLKENKIPWEINVIDVGVNQVPKWCMNATKYRNGGYARGEQMQITMTNGKTTSNRWSSMP
jgi:hypothetical protein